MSTPPVSIDEAALPLFMGISRRAARRGLDWDLLGLSNVILFPFFPQSLSGLQCVLGFPRRTLTGGAITHLRVIFTDVTKPSNHAWAEQRFSEVVVETAEQFTVDKVGYAIEPVTPSGSNSTVGMQMLTSAEDTASIELMPITSPPLTMRAPGRVYVDIEVNGVRYRRGEFLCVFAPPAPLTDSERRAIASRPGASKHLQMNIGCKLCNTTGTFYTQLDPTAPPHSKLSPGAIYLATAPQQWSCTCGEVTFDLNFLKSGFHELFRRAGTRTSKEGPVSFVPMYEHGRIRDILAEYELLIDSATEEEPVQKYLEENPVLWSFLSPTNVLHKPPVLTKKRADFGIVTAQKILYLVEIEKPTTKLLNQDGSISAEIQRGANQIRDWQQVVDDHKLALLSELSLSDKEVLAIRYLLIGGMARRTPTGLAKIRRTPFAADTDFYCFDELGSFLYSISGELNRL